MTRSSAMTDRPGTAPSSPTPGQSLSPAQAGKGLGVVDRPGTRHPNRVGQTPSASHSRATSPRGGETTSFITAFLGLGANAGDRLAALQTAIRSLSAQDGIVVDAVSPVYETEAHVLPGQQSQPDHLNAVARLATDLSAEALLATFQTLEREAGRDPAAPRWSPRPLDLDLLLYGDAVIDRPGLTVPHPRLALRRFVLQPLADLAPGRLVPVLGQTVADLLAACPDATRIEPTDYTLF